MRPAVYSHRFIFIMALSVLLPVLLLFSFELNAASAEPSKLEKTKIEKISQVERLKGRQRTRNLRAYEAQVTELEGRYGAYEPRLSEAWQGLGEAHQGLGQHLEAIEAFQKAMQIKRVNEGLYSSEAAPILESMIESYSQLEDWKAVDDRFFYLMNLQRKSLGLKDPKILPMIKKLSQWHLYAFSEGLGDDSLGHLHTARSLFHLAVEVIEKNYGSDDLRLVEQLRGELIADYYLTVLAQAQQTQEALVMRSSSGDIFGEPKRISVNKAGYQHGLRTISQIVALYENNPDAPSGAYALALTELGDWYLMFNKRRSAFQTYERVQYLMQENPQLHAIERATFGLPVVMPNFSEAYFEYVDLPKTNKKQGYVLLKIGVNALGVVRESHIVDRKPTTPNKGRQALRESRTTRFRPAFAGGKPIYSRGIHYRYLYEYDAKPE